MKDIHDMIPGGGHTYSKGDDQFPANAPKFIARGKGCYLWDENDNKFLDFSICKTFDILIYNFFSLYIRH